MLTNGDFRCAGVRKNCLMVLSHLILNDMMKVKGHIARLALCLQDDEPRIAALASVFFHELSRKASKVLTCTFAASRQNVAKVVYHTCRGIQHPLGRLHAWLP